MGAPRVLCPFHEESTPSCVVYEERYKCFGCGASGPVEELPLEKQPSNGRTLTKFRNNKFADTKAVAYMLKYIENLPTKAIRGFELPVDALGYYIRYPNKPYYIKRLFAGNNSSKYKYPKHVSKPLWISNLGDVKTLLVIEGQLNAMVAAKLKPSITVCSPGGATDLYAFRYMKHYLQYTNICAIVDKDVAGVSAALELKTRLAAKDKTLAIYPMKVDLNDIYVQQGKQAAEQELDRALALLGMR